ncbi:MbtH family NRPS accessory protein [Sorangium sp. So ce321]|uniref:MbtH family protein n=1 Tax=Sorangium sp. So ce321 TaxID=3133300 RepID=UPI003F5E7743
MNPEQEDDKTIYDVVVNQEEQYSIWPKHRDVPLGWQAVGKSGLKSECLEYVREVWTDMRPLSLRKKMAELEAQRPELERAEARRLEEASKTPKAPQDDLVEFLSNGEHPVEAWLQPERSVEQLNEALRCGFVHVKFTDTRGGTLFGFSVDRDASDLGRADFDKGTGGVHLEGVFTLNYVKVRCVADLELETLAGRGKLVRVE